MTWPALSTITEDSTWYDPSNLLYLWEGVMPRPKKGIIERLINRGEAAEAPISAEGGTIVDPERLYIGREHKEVFELQNRPSVEDLERMIYNDGQAQQLASAIRLPIRGAKWSIEKAKDDRGEAQFVRDVLTKAPYEGGMTTAFDTVLSQIAYGVVTRRAFFEKVWKLDDEGRAVYHKLAWRPASTCEVRADSSNGSFAGFIQRGIKGHKEFMKEFDPPKAFVYIHSSDLSPLSGQTAFDTVYKDHQQKLKVKYLYFSFLENVAYPKLKAQYTGSEKGGLKNLVKKTASLARGAVVGLGDREEVQVLESTRTSQEYIKALAYLDSQMSKSVLSTFLDLGTTGDRGSYALSKDQSNFFFTSLEAVLDEIAAAINAYLVPDLVFYNFGVNAHYPVFKFSPIEDETKDIALEVFKALQLAANPRISQNFYEELIMKVSNIMGLDSDKVVEDINTVYQPAEGEGIQQGGGVPTGPNDATKTPGYQPRTNSSNRGRPSNEERSSGVFRQ